MQAVSSVTGLPLDHSDRAAGLRLIATSDQMSDRHRVAACADLAKHDWKSAYTLLKTLIPIESVLVHLDHRARVGRGAGCDFGLLRQLSVDTALASSDRFSAAEYVEQTDPSEALAIYLTLAQCSSLGPSQRAKAASLC